MHSSLTQLVQLGLRMSVRPECPKIFESLASNGPKLTSSSTNKLCSDVQFILIKDYLSGLFEIQSKDYFRRNYFSKSSANGFNWLWLFSFKFLVDAISKFSCLTVKNSLSDTEVCCHETLIQQRGNSHTFFSPIKHR